MFHASGNTINISASTASTNMALTSDGSAPHVMVGNNSDGWAHVVFGGSSIASTFPTTSASAEGTVIPPGMAMFLTPGTKATYVGVSLSSGTGNVYATPGLLD